MSDYAQMRLVALGMVLGLLIGAGLWARPARPDPVPVQEVSTPRPRETPPAPLRCANGDPPRVWSQVDLEGQIHLAIQARDTAMMNAWNPTAERWVRIGQLTVEIVKLCRGD